MSRQVIETLGRMITHKEAHRPEHVESGPVAQGYCDGYRAGVLDAKLLIEAEAEGPAVILLRRWERAYREYDITVTPPGSMHVGTLINDTAKFLREVKHDA